MRAASLPPLPDRQHDDSDPQQWPRQQQQQQHQVSHLEQNEAIYAPEISAAVSHKYDVDGGNDSYFHHEEHIDEDGDLVPATVMTHVSVDCDADPEHAPGSPDSDMTINPDLHPHERFNFHFQEDHDLEMSDSDGGVPLDSNTATAELVNSDYGYDSDDDLSLQDDEHDDLPTTTEFYSPDGAFPLHVTNPQDLDIIMNAALPAAQPDLWANMTSTSATESASIPGTQQTIDDLIDNLPPVLLSNPNPSILGSENLGLIDFLRSWAYRHQFGPPNARPRSPPLLQEVLKEARTEVNEVRYSDLDGDRCDFQGLDWSAMQTTRETARRRRRMTYKNYVNRLGSDNCSVSST